jgi:hypothetical protein
MKSTLPKDFSGMLFAPSEENSVYILLGLLWKYLPLQIAFESFEIDPLGQKYSHTKWLDAKAKVFKNGEWKDVSIEFKTRSSSFRSDLVRHPGVSADLLICWEHDAPDIKPHFGDIIELRKIYWSLLPEERKKIILEPDLAGKILGANGNLKVLISKLSNNSQAKVKMMIDNWKTVACGTSEWKFYAGTRIAMRVGAYKKESIQVLFPFAGEVPDLLEKYNGKRNKGGISVLLEPLRNEDVLGILEKVRTVARYV